MAVLLLIAGCRPQPPKAAKEPETLSRTEFTDRIENFFEHDPLRPGKPTRFLIHLTDLSDGSPVEKAGATKAPAKKIEARPAAAVPRPAKPAAKRAGK